ncbi:MAG: lytic transglycosylase domain-containing protein [Defluviitaleaceae bacterium]|nr:lytic transglycosylase domain-containing protein [Defluviitaleaceae bacterium]
MNFNLHAISHQIQSQIHQSVIDRLTPNRNSHAGHSVSSATPANTPPVANEVHETDSFQNILNDFISLGVSNTNINPQIDAAITAASLAHGVDANLIRAIIRAESNYNPLTVSSAGAMGLMQLMPATARQLGVENPFDINENINAGTQYIAGLLDRFNGDVELALAAYNAGWPRVQQHGGIPPIAETQNYVPRVLGFRQEYIMQQYQQNTDNRRR